MCLYTAITSPPSRAAWIEIMYESVERTLDESPPSRAAWIEIINLASISGGKFVAAFTGGVD